MYDYENLKETIEGRKQENYEALKLKFQVLKLLLKNASKLYLKTLLQNQKEIST